jgi:endoglucanase
MLIHRQLLILIILGSIVACGGGSGKGGSAQPVPASSRALASTSSTFLNNSSNSSSINNSTSSSSNISSSVASSVSSLSAVVTPIVVDQLGYLPDAQKMAVVRDPQVGYDAALSFTPSATLSLVNLTTHQSVFTAAPAVWNPSGIVSTDASSGDKVWWFDFSNITTPGTYAVVDIGKNLRSPSFKIASDVYKPVLKHALRTFFYQRAGFAKQAPYADNPWVDAASHLGAGQDAQARLYSDKNNPATEKNLSGGWYDAGDYSKYTNWAADYVVTLSHAYLENPSAWTDDFNIPESGNGIPDILDEIKWGVDWLKKMQDATGNNSVLSILDLDEASPPSAATGQSYYGPANTSATLTTAGAFAVVATIFADQSTLATYADDLKMRAENAWTWAIANPNIIFRNNEGAASGIGAGQQETDDAGRAIKKRVAAIYLFSATDKTTYRDFVDSDYTNADMKNFVDPFREAENMALLYYANLPNATITVANTIKTWFKNHMNSTDNWQAINGSKDPYRAFLADGQYTWGSNATKSRKGSMYMNLLTFNITPTNATNSKNAAMDFLHYLHGVNPQAMVYLSNMYSLGVQSSVNEFYHSWFRNGSTNWDRVGTSVYGPAPGFLVGGPNPYYNWDSNCSSPTPNVGCGSAAPSPPRNQPPQKSYLDFNTSWPLNSWEVTENSNGYQSDYLRLLSKFVN